jgi:hypothetical protein
MLVSVKGRPAQAKPEEEIMSLLQSLSGTVSNAVAKKSDGTEPETRPVLELYSG